MSKRLYIGGFLLAVLAVSWLWKTEATNPQTSSQAADAAGISEEHLVAQLTKESDVILSGRCLDTKSEWIADGRILVTLASIEVNDVLKGGRVSRITVVLPGGVDANRRIPVAMTYPGAPRISQDEEVFLFLKNDDSVQSGYAITGFSGGKYSIVNDEAGNRLISRDNIQGQVDAGPGIVRGNRQFTPLESFKNSIKTFMAR